MWGTWFRQERAPFRSRDCARKNSRRLEVEPLERRWLMSWGDIPPAAVRVSSRAVPVILDDQADAQGVDVITRRETDLYSFVAPTTGTYHFSTSTPDSSLDTVLAVFEVNGRRGSRIAFNDDIVRGVNTDSQVSANLLAGQRFAFGITNYSRTAGGSYVWSVDGPSRDTVGDDEYEQNDNRAQAYDLGSLSAPLTITGLAMADSRDWYRFQMTQSGTSSDHVAVRFSNDEGDLDLRLYNSTGTKIRSSDGTSDVEQVSLDQLAAGTYYVEVYGYVGATNPDYSLEISPGSGTNPAGTRSKLYLDFDGAVISRSDLVRWADRDWSGMVNELDADRNGITVRPFLDSRSDREQIIQRVLSMVQADLSPFRVSVERHTGLAVEKVGATTVFVGPASLSYDYYHVACDIDYGNDNRTDIAFVGDEAWRSASDTATAIADLVIHEAGHTWGLHHVASGSNPETMGLRYSISDERRWVTDTRYMDRTFDPLATESGGAYGPGPQNSYQTLLRNFSSASQGSTEYPARVSASPRHDAGVMQAVLRSVALPRSQGDLLATLAEDRLLHQAGSTPNS